MNVLGAGLIVLAGVAAYGNSLSAPFLFDDAGAIVTNDTIRGGGPIWKPFCPPSYGCTVSGRPVLNVSFAVNYALSGLNVLGYHVVNLAIHLAAALVLFGIARRTAALLPGLSPRPAARARDKKTLRAGAVDVDRPSSAATAVAVAVALLWAVHPLQTESVTYVAQRAESLMGLFYLLTLYCFIRGEGSPRAIVWHAASAAACLLGMATKEVMVSAPLIVLLYDRTFLAGSFREAWRRHRGYYLALAATWLVLAGLVIGTGLLAQNYGKQQPSSQWFTWWEYLATEPGVIVHYLRLAFWPSGLCLDYNWPAAKTLAAVLLPAILLLTLLVLTIWALVKTPAWGFLGAWFFLILAPTSSFLPVQGAAAFEHRMYLPLLAVIGSVVAGACLAGQWLARRRIASLATLGTGGACLAACAAVALGAATFQRNATFRSDLSIWRDTVAKAPGSYRAHTNLGVVLAGHGQFNEAVNEYHRALDVMPDDYETHYNLGNALAHGRQFDEAVAEYRRTLDINPNYVGAEINLGLALAGHGEVDEAIVHYKKALKIQPRRADAHFNLANALAGRGNGDEAILHYREALEIQPADFDTQHDLANLLARRGQFDEAIEHYRKALEIDSSHIQAHGELGDCLACQGKIDEALAQYRAALDLAVSRKDETMARFIRAGMVRLQAARSQSRDNGGRPR